MIRRRHRTEESQTRYWAGQAVALCQLIDDTSLDEYAEGVRAAADTLLQDRRVLVFGGKGSGKSSLVAGLAGSSAPRSAEWEGGYVRWRYLCPDGDAENSRFLPCEDLEGLELTDTAACSKPEVAEVLPELMQGADAIIATIDARQPDEAPAWEPISAMPAELYPNCLLALTFADTLPAEATLELGKRVQEICRGRTGKALGLCICNPNSAQSMAEFAARVQELLDAPHGVLRPISRLAGQASVLVKRQESILTARAAVARTDTVFMGNIEQEIDNFLSRQIMGAERLADAYAAVVSAAMPKLRFKLRRVLGWWLSPVTILRLEQLAAGTEQCLYDLLCGEIRRLQKDADSQFVISCEAHWKSVRPRMAKTLACEIGDFPDSPLQQQLLNLRNELCHGLYEPFMHLSLRHRLAKTFNAPSGWMLNCLWAICLCLIPAGLLGFFGQDLPALACVAMALAVWLSGSLAHLLFVRRALAGLASCAESLSDGLRTALHERIRNFIVSRVTAYRVLYMKPRQTVASHSKMLKPLQDRHHHIKIGLKDAAPRG